MLVPRPETELLVEETIELIKEQGVRSKEKKITLIDIGTGSGCIPIAIAKSLTNQSTNKLINQLLIIATDISPDALVVARRNARTHHVKIKFLHGNLLSPLLKKSYMLHVTCSNHLIITANLPYGWKAWKNNCSMNSAGLKFEPPQALFTGKHGLQLYEGLFKQVNSLSIFNLQSSIIVEFDPRQTKLLCALIKRTLPNARVQIKKDLAGLDRVAIIIAK